MMQALIVGDERETRARLSDLCRRSRDLNVVAERGWREAMQELAAGQVELVLFDVAADPARGFDVLRALISRQELAVIVVGRQSAHAVCAYDLGALDYFELPISEERFARAIERARRRLAGQDLVSRLTAQIDAVLGERRSSLLAVQKANRFFFIDVCSIDFIRSDRNHVVITLGERQYLCRDSVKHLSRPLAQFGFLRIHRSLLINLGRVAYFERHGAGEFMFTLSNGQQVISGSRYRRIIQATMQCRPIQHPIPNGARGSTLHEGLQERTTRASAAASSLVAMVCESSQ